LWVRADDGRGFGAWAGWLMSTSNTAPVVSASVLSATVQRNQSVAASSLFGVSDADGDTIAQYEFWDSGAEPSSGHFSIDGIVQPAGQAIALSAANLSHLSYVGGTQVGAETVWARANDGADWSEWKSRTVNTLLSPA
jgi:hypothetical protein